MKTHSKPAAQSVVRRYLTGLVAITMVLGPIGDPAYAALTKLTDQPIAAKVNAKPNIVYTLDDSGSMNLNYLPDFVSLNYCRSGTGLTACGAGANFNFPPFWAADFNHLTYNPNVTYLAPKHYDNTSYPDQTAAFSTNWTKVQRDPYLAPLVTDNLAAVVAVPLYCNSDWPLDTTIGANGEYQAGKGADCRINGTRYDAFANGAPVALDDYNYPWSWTVAPPNPKYFWRNGGNKTLWCDTTNVNWPKTCTPNGIYSCTVGVPTGGTNQPQTCYFQSNAMGCNPVAGSRTYTPAACNATPTYCAPGVGGSGANTPGTGTVPTECAACTCNNDTVTGKNGACHLTANGGPPGTGGSGTGCNCAGVGCVLPACANFVTPPTGCTLGGILSQGQNCVACVNGGAACTCNSLLGGQGPGGTTLQDDANLVNGGTGTICRRNNISYAGVGGPAASPVNYTSLPLDPKYKTQMTVGGLCTAVPSTVNIPRHYYTIDSVQYCNNTIVVNNAQWKGFGTGVCQNKNDFIAGVAGHTNIQYGQFHRIDLVNDGRTFAFTDANGPGTRTYAQEMTNYSNWWSYYHTRILAGKSIPSIAFAALDQTWRVGFHTLSTPATNWVDVKDWTPGVAGQRNTWYTKLFGVTIPPVQTPTLDALLRVGELFKTGAGGAGALPAMPEGYIPATATDPINVSCQNNFHILFTDGFTNQAVTPNPAWIGEKDGGNVPVFPPDPDPANHPEVTVAGLNALSGGPWPSPFKDPIPTANTLADIALYYWMTDLRPVPPWPASIGTDNVPSDDGRIGPPGICSPVSSAGALPPPPNPCAAIDWTSDPAFWQHVNFSAISFGSEGILDASNHVAVTNSIASGATQWFTAPNTPTPPNNPGFPAGNKGATAVDDLWHATVNARGSFVYAKSPFEAAVGLTNIIAGISNNRKSRAGAAFAGQALSASNNRIFEATIEKGWAGDLEKVQIDPTTGKELIQPPDWSAGSLLNTLLATPLPGTSPALDSDNTWFKNRRIVAWKPGAGAVPFLFANLSAAQLATLSADPVVQQKMIAYLRGGSTFGPGPSPPLIEGTAIGQFRKRFGKLGDISDSQPVVVGPTASPPIFYEATDPGITAFGAAHAARAPRIFVGANDGMLHVFDAGALNGPDGGTEMFAYIPSALFNNLNDENGSPKGIQALTYQDGGIPFYTHHFYVNATPRAVDVDFANTGGAGGSGDWHTIVVGGLGKGGNVYYAIDATNPTVVTDTEAAIAPKVLWEFTRPDIQFTFGRPVIGKTRADGWVVVVTSGYDNVSGTGQIHFINAKTGALIRTMNTPAADETGTPGSPSGLTQINGFTKDFHNQIIEQIYGGDLNGKVWRFDVSDPNPANWKAVLFAKLTDPSGAPQPVTTAPQIEIDINNGVDRWVFFGTGRLLHPDDLTIPSPEQIETFYAIRDGTVTAPDSSVGFLPVIPRGNLAVGNALTTTPIVGGAPKGWYIDLPLGQRVVVDPVADLNVAAFVATAAPNDPCTTALPAFVYARDFTTAESDIVNGAGVPQPSFFSAAGAVSLEVVALQDPSSAFPKLSLIFSKETTGATASVPLKVPSITGGHRMSWRLLGQ